MPSLPKEGDERALEVTRRDGRSVRGHLRLQLLRTAPEEPLSIGENEHAIGVLLRFQDIVRRVDDRRPGARESADE
jgi:hypothetical protein